jgi:chemotaxis protein methyltransferase CheR
VESKSVSNIELDLLLDAIYRHYGYDFRNYSRPSIERRIQQFVELEHIESISDLIKPVLHSREFAFHLIKHFSISVSEMFRDPHVYQSILNHIIPILRTYPSFKIWHAGCANGQEVYSLAILLKEAGILDHATIFATDINEEALDTAKKGIYPICNIQSVCKSYREAGGKNSFTHYFHAAYNAITMDSELRRRITFANHDLVRNTSFGKMNLIMCRNVLIYFDHELQKKAWQLFSRSLADDGFICLGSAEHLPLTGIYSEYETIDSNSKIYQKPSCSLQLSKCL